MSDIECGMQERMQFTLKLISDKQKLEAEIERLRAIELAARKVQRFCTFVFPDSREESDALDEFRRALEGK